MNYKLHYLP